MLAERGIVVSHTTIMRWVLLWGQSIHAAYAEGRPVLALLLLIWRQAKTLSLGTYPDIPFSRAKERHQAARQLLAVGLDPSLKRKDLRREGG
jgi:hypothetical protein